jgi:predicted flap endonuclease-1-like 5' DNA nuclease
MASFLYLVGGLVVGLIGGWFLRGLRPGTPQPTESTTPAPTSPEPATAAVAEPATVPAAEPAAVEAEPAADAHPAAATPPEPAAEEPVSEVEPVAVVAEPEPVAIVAEPELVVVIPEPEPEPVAVAAAPEPVVAVTPEPAPAAVAVVKADNLTKIAGIGPKMATALVAAGITTYRQLADSDESTLSAALAAAGVRSAPTIASWPERAKQMVDATS